MKKLNPIERTRYIDRRYKEYLRSSFRFGNGKLQRIFEKELSEAVLLKGPYVALNLPFQRGKSINELIEESTICHSFKELNSIDFERPLYSHQEESIRKIGNKRSAVITTGTGSGKTECFLYPILNDILTDLENGNREIGIRSIFLYPMNALVNDQIDRVREILTGYDDITFGFFTGDTPNTVALDYRERFESENGVVIPPNELVSREEIRTNPPHLLFTNYSMLEYLLIRPNDYSIFSPDRLANWKYVVLDEAHSYYGSLGIELSMLMRRLTGLAENKPRFILTSATLGDQGKSEKEIVEFARNLTSAVFDEDDIIFSKRIPLTITPEYVVSGEDYIALKEHSKEPEAVAGICETYHIQKKGSISECLYELLCKDKHVHEIYRLLKAEAKTFSFIHQHLDDLSDNELIALIDLINMAEKNGIGLFDLKYHSFIRPLSGAYMTLEPEPALSLSETNYIKGFKAFELGNCRYCSAPYLIGKVQPGAGGQLQYLYQNREIDIYENYGNNVNVRLDYFLLDNRIDDEEIDANILEENTLCAKCGCIYPTGNLNAKHCDCDESHKLSVWRVVQIGKDGKLEAYNNLSLCPCCGRRSRSGIVKSLNVGKDEGTAIVAQTLFEAIDEGTEVVRKAGKLSLKANKDASPALEEKDNKVKQFLSFSDSRQQASFAAVFLDSNHVRMLRKRLIWQVIEDQQYRDLPVDELASYLTEIIKHRNLFSDGLTAHKHAWLALLIDLLKVDGSYDGEGMGLYYFDLDLSEIMSQFDEEDVREAFGQYSITKKDLETMMQVTLGVFKTTPAIDYVKSTLTPDERLEHLDFRRFDNHVAYSLPSMKDDVRSFLPVRNGSNMVIRYVQKVCNCSDEEAKGILDVLFNNLAVGGGLLKKYESKNAYQIEARKYILRNYKQHKYYQCSKCGNLTPYNVHDVCVQDKCKGTLKEVDPDVVLGENYYRKQYQNKKIESVVIREHTAQLERKKAKQYQQEFKEKKINILSCSTTFEMGIDIGALETVFMRNVPPSPANYVQRAGRAGRRRDSSAYILTYCGTSSHDYTYFAEPEKMISGVIQPPYFNVLNKKIIIRHLMASCLGSFFRQSPKYFQSIDMLVFGDGQEAFHDYMMSHPEELNNYINNGVLPEEVYANYHNFKWFEDMGGEDEKLNHFIEIILQMEKEFEEAKEEALSEEKYSDAAYFSRQIEHLHKTRVIDSLSKYCVIPKYGFPVDVVELQIYNKGIPDNSYDLTRDLKIAISEYAPDSEVIVDRKKYTSKYLTLPKASEFPRHYFCTCLNCKKVNVFLSAGSTRECKYCGASIDAMESEFFIEPVNGFKTGVTKESSRIKPRRSYSGEVSYLGGGRVESERLEIGETIRIETSSDDELLVMNRSDFYMCPVCGYSDIRKNQMRIPIRTVGHKNCRQFDCSNEKLERVRLGHIFQTDVARFIIPSLRSDGEDAYSKALSFMYAFLEGISNALGIERKDINGIVEMNLSEGSYDILLYDDVPGGAGHIKRLVKEESVIKALESALTKVSQDCCDENTSCYNCLRNYNNQAYHSRLRRVYAKNVLKGLLDAIE